MGCYPGSKLVQGFNAYQTVYGTVMQRTRPDPLILLNFPLIWNAPYRRTNTLPCSPAPSHSVRMRDIIAGPVIAKHTW